MKDHRRKFLKIPDHSAKILETRNKTKVYIFYLVVFVFDSTMVSL